MWSCPCKTDEEKAIGGQRLESSKEYHIAGVISMMLFVMFLCFN